MKVTYNGVALHDLGRLVIAGESSIGEPAEAPLRWRRRLRVRLDTSEFSYSGNRAALESVVNALRVTDGTLRWEEDGGRVYLDRDVIVVGHTFPDDPNAWGTFRQAVEVEFEYEDHGLSPRAQQATWQTAGSATVIALDRVERVTESFRVSRFSTLRDNRESVVSQLTLAGRFKAESGSVEQRRAVLLATKDAFTSQIRTARNGRLIFGTMDRTVRVESAEADIDQRTMSLPWSLSVTWSDFPNESGYAQAQYRARTSEDTTTGELTLALDGSIGADTETRARSKLTALRAVMAPPVDWEAVSLESEVSKVDDTGAGTAGGDGEAFLMLGFSDRYRKVTGDILDYELRIDEADDAKSAMLRSTYSGYVVARGVSDDAAWSAAVAKARALGDHKHQFKLSGRETRVQGQREGTRFVVRAEFAYEYQRKGSRVYVELTGIHTREAFGADSERVQGRVGAASWADAGSVLQDIKASYDGLIRNETITRGSEQIGADGLAPSLPAGGARASMETSFEFSFEVARTKGSGDLAMRYDIDVDDDLVRRERVTTLEGSVFGPTQAACEAHLDALLGAFNPGKRIRSKRRTSHERAPNFAGQDRQFFVALAFTETHTAPLAGADQILETSLSEEIQCSGARRVVAPTAASTDVIQTCGTQSGRRTVRGRVTALTETTAMAWARRQRQLPYLGPAPVERYETPPECTIEHATVPLSDPVVRTGTYGELGAFTRREITAVTVNFTFTDLLPLYDPIS